MADYFDDEYGEEDDSFGVPAEPAREFTVFLVDASEAMNEPAGLRDVEGMTDSDTFMDLAVKAIQEIMKQHVVGSPKDQMAVVFYGARPTEPPGAFENVAVHQKLGPLTARRIKQVEELLGDGFDRKVGSGDSGKPADDLHYGLWQAQQIFQESASNVRRRTLIFTTNPDPSGSDTSLREMVMQKAKQLQETKVEVLLFNLTPPDKEFSMSFWSGIVHDPDFPSEPRAINIEDLPLHVRYKTYRKRALAKMTFRFGPGVTAAVKLYALVMKATPSKSVQLHSQTMEVIKRETNFVCADTGHVLQKSELKYSFPKAGPGTPPNVPKMIFTAEERQAMKIQMPAGITLIGFKKMCCLKPWHQIRHSTFLYPDEKAQRGSTTLLVAMHGCMLQRDEFALCSLVRSKGSQPRHVAMVAQEEVKEEGSGIQLVAPGFNLIYLPYADDIRSPETDYSLVGPPPYPEPTQEQLDAFSALIDKLRLEDFEPATVPNPHLQRHYQVLEAVALGETPPPMRPEDDLTLPNNQAIQAAAMAELLACRDALYGPGSDGGAAEASKKRKAQTEAPDDEEVKEMVASGTLHKKLTVARLKEFCRQHRLSQEGLKAELVQRVTEYVQR